MENASKALIMAATILIAVMLISLGTYLFATFANYSKNKNDNINEKTKQEFNAQFKKYETSETEELCTVYDIVTIINLAKNSNSKYEEYSNGRNNANYSSDSNSYIYVLVTKENVNEISDETTLNGFISSHNSMNSNTNNYMDLYNCKVNISNQTGLVKSIIFTKK